MKQGYLFITDDDKVFGQADYTRLNALPFYKRWYAKINKRYREKYIDIKPFDVEYRNPRTYTITTGLDPDEPFSIITVLDKDGNELHND